MLRIDFVTLFPEMVLGAMRHSIPRRAAEAGLFEPSAVNPRDFATDIHRTVDDEPFGGGPGMVLMAEPLALAIESLSLPKGAPVILTDPNGERFSQEAARSLSEFERIAIVCGHYGGIDGRVRELFATHVYSVGEFVVTGGELPALLIADAIVRLVPGVLGSDESAASDAFAEGLLSAPQYTRPAEFRGMEVPEVLRSGDHAAAAKWKRTEALRQTRRQRPDLFWRARLEKADADMLSS